MSITPDNPVEGGEKQRQARIAQSDALTPAGALHSHLQGDLESGFLGAELAEEHDEVTAVAARGYWEGIWLRLKRDKLAIAGAIFIVFLFIVAFVGAPLAATPARPWSQRHQPDPG